MRENKHVRLVREHEFDLTAYDLEPGMLVEWSTKPYGEVFLVIWSGRHAAAKLVSLVSPADTYTLVPRDDFKRVFRKLPKGTRITLEVTS